MIFSDELQRACLKAEKRMRFAKPTVTATFEALAKFLSVVAQTCQGHAYRDYLIRIE